jgi:MerR family Zn(II)-responsive transcriptional regulator of zntA
VSESRLLKVSEVSRRTGLTRKALRLYESLGLVEPAERTQSGYRLYDDEALRRIELVNRAKMLGLTLAEAKEFLHVAEGCCGEHHPELAFLVGRKLAETERRLAELSTLRETLTGVLDRLEANRGVHRCEEALCTCQGLVTIQRRRPRVSEHAVCECGCCGPGDETATVAAEAEVSCRCECGCAGGEGCTCNCAAEGCTCGCAGAAA